MSYVNYMIEKNRKRIFIGRICHAIDRYAKASDKYMEDYDKNKEWKFRNLKSLQPTCLIKNNMVHT